MFYYLLLQILPVAPVAPVGNVNGGIGGNVGPTKIGFDVAADNNSLEVSFLLLNTILLQFIPKRITIYTICMIPKKFTGKYYFSPYILSQALLYF